MCGIFGFVAAQQRDMVLVLDGLRALEYRGYDSWGIALAQNNTIHLEKAVGPISVANPQLPPAALALGHTRWATHGGVTQENAHPHLDCSGRFALIHNGIVENHRELAGSLRRPHRFRSQTDTEVLVHVLEEVLEREGDLLASLCRVFGRVQGLSAVAVLDAWSDQIVAAKNGSPLVLGWGEDAFYLASDAAALAPMTRTVTFLEDGQAVRLTPDGAALHDIRSLDILAPRRATLDPQTCEDGRDGHSHYMTKEIWEQPRVLRAIAANPAGVPALAEAIGAASDVLLVGCGTAYHAALHGRQVLSRAGVRAMAMMASEIEVARPFMGPDTLVIALSQSGETIDALDAVRLARGRGARIAAIVNATGSSLERAADVVAHLQCGPERCVLATKSYTAKLAVLEMVASILSGSADAVSRDLMGAADAIEEMLEREMAEGTICDTARRITSDQHLFVLGRSTDYPSALEAALKIKEVCYMHAEGFASGELKHGVIALVTNGTPCVILAPGRERLAEALSTAAEVHARGAFTIGVSPEPDAEFDVTLPVSGKAPVYESAVTAQLLAYQLALGRGCDPDKPRNLAKSVTVR